MSVICFSSLKGGVGKTTLSVNVAHAFAQRGCRTLIIDFDPAGHASRLFLANRAPGGDREDVFRSAVEPIARYILSKDFDTKELEGKDGGISESAARLGEIAQGCFTSLRPELEILPSGAELRHFLWGRGSRVFATAFPEMLRQLKQTYDHIIIDTPPDFNVLTRNAIASADMVVVPVDSSEMSINSLEELVRTAQHIRGPVWSIVRTMVTRNASRVRKMTNESLRSRLSVGRDGMEQGEGPDFADTEYFMEILRSRRTEDPDNTKAQSPLYLLRSMVARTEQHNRLSFLGKTAFEGGAAAVELSKQYLSVARELEEIIAYLEDVEAETSGSDLLEAIASVADQAEDDQPSAFELGAMGTEAYSSHYGTV